MTDVNTDTGDADTGIPYAPGEDNEGLARVLDPKSFQPEPEKPETFHSDHHGIKKAADEHRKNRGSEGPTKIRTMDRDARPLTGPRDAAERIAGTRRYERAEKLAEVTGARSGNAQEFVGLSVYEAAQHEHEPTPREYADKDARPNARKAAADVAEARTVADPAAAQERTQQFKNIVELLNGDEELARQALGEQQRAPEAGTEPAQPQVDPVAQARQQAAELEIAQHCAAGRTKRFSATRNSRRRSASISKCFPTSTTCKTWGACGPSISNSGSVINRHFTRSLLIGSRRRRRGS